MDPSSAAPEHGLDTLDPSTTPAHDATHFRRVIAARTARDDADQQLHEAVADARAAGGSWTIIGAALDITHQAARWQFGRALTGDHGGVHV